MSFWDASALFPLLVPETTSRVIEHRYTLDPAIAVWWATRIECISAIEQLNREGRLRAAQVTRAYAALDAVAGSWQEVEPTDAVRESAIRFLRVHALRAADALQLAAAFAFAEGRPSTLEFLSLDGRLVDAARREGFRVVDIH